MPALVFITTFARNIYCKNNWARYDKYAYVFMQITSYSSQILINLKFAQKICEKYSSLLFKKFCPLGAELLHLDGRTDRQSHKTNLTVAFRKFGKKLNP